MDGKHPVHFYFEYDTLFCLFSWEYNEGNTYDSRCAKPKHAHDRCTPNNGGVVEAA